MRWARHKACMGEMRNGYKSLDRKPETGDHMEDLGVNGSIILK
jgi:hypothetical protein